MCVGSRSLALAHSPLSSASACSSFHHCHSVPGFIVAVYVHPFARRGRSMKPVTAVVDHRSTDPFLALTTR